MTVITQGVINDGRLSLYMIRISHCCRPTLIGEVSSLGNDGALLVHDMRWVLLRLLASLSAQSPRQWPPLLLRETKRVS
jgi:hypothetical protein